VGAAKSGTTSVVATLGQHPDVFVPAIKEPFYFSFPDLKPKWAGPNDPNDLPVYKWSDYVALYEQEASKRVRIDGSTSYLYDANVPARISAAVPDAKIIAILSHPVDRAYSAFLHVRRRTTEETADFRLALSNEEERIRAGFEHLWHYRAMSVYTPQLKRWFKSFPREQIKVLLYDDLVRNPRGMFEETCQWLDLDPRYLPDEETRENVSEAPRSVSLKRMLLSENPLKKLLVPALGKSLRQMVWRLNTYKPSFPDSLRKELADDFVAEIKELQELIERDLSHWLP
jgi:hypothetical protein